MNPFTGTLTRFSYFLWSLFIIAMVVGFGASVDAVKDTQEGMFWPLYRILFILALFTLSILVFIRRLQNAGLSPALICILFVPVFGILFWIIALFFPPKQQSKKVTKK